jgi:hypothetical protein
LGEAVSKTGGKQPLSPVCSCDKPVDNCVDDATVGATEICENAGESVPVAVKPTILVERRGTARWVTVDEMGG